MYTRHDLIMAVKELAERHWDVAEIAVKLRVDIGVVQAIIDLLTQEYYERIYCTSWIHYGNPCIDYGTGVFVYGIIWRNGCYACMGISYGYNLLNIKVKQMNKLVKTENEHLYPSGGLVIPHEVADGITRANLIDAKRYLQSELDKWAENPKDELNPTGYWMHPNDVVGNGKLIRAFSLIIDYYGGE